MDRVKLIVYYGTEDGIPEMMFGQRDERGEPLAVKVTGDESTDVGWFWRKHDQGDDYVVGPFTSRTMAIANAVHTHTLARRYSKNAGQARIYSIVVASSEPSLWQRFVGWMMG